MYKFGLKLWSTNKQYIKPALELFEKGIFSYIELFSVPNSFKECINLWKPLNIPFVIHAPHTHVGLNLAKKDQFKKNILLAQEAQCYADALNTDTIIFHPGVNGDIQETIRQLNIIDDNRILIENKPYYTINNNRICNGHSPKEIESILQSTNVGFCLDLGHAIYSANAKKIDGISYIKSFMQLSPIMFHLTDGNYYGTYDDHAHFGTGSFDLKKILKMLPKQNLITIETVKDNIDNLSDFAKDIRFLKKLIGQLIDITIQPAQLSDMMDVFHIANDPTVRMNAFNPKTISLSDHQTWFRQKISNKNDHFYVIRTKEKELIGYIRFDQEKKDDENNYLVTIHLHEKFRGYGLGSKLIQEVSYDFAQKFPKKKIHAYVKERNKPSLKSLLKSGYTLQTHEKRENTIWLKLTHQKKR